LIIAAAIVERARRHGRRVATPAEAAALLRLSAARR
jgi:hypothetical protein